MLYVDVVLGEMVVFNNLDVLFVRLVFEILKGFFLDFFLLVVLIDEIFFIVCEK